MINLVIVSNKFFGSDFRKHLMRAAVKAGGKALHVHYDQRVILSREGREELVYDKWSDDEIAQKIKTEMGPDLCLVLTGFGLKKIALLKAMRKIMARTLYIYDIYDDFFYGARGWTWLSRALEQLRYFFFCDIKIILEEGLWRRFPKAYFLLNASHLQKLDIPDDAPSTQMVYIGSLDDRTDFDWLEALVEQDITLDIYGRIHVFSRELEARVRRLLAKSAKVKYFGAYDNDDLPDILKKYRVGIVPYKAGSSLTNHINPDKIYHYLNAGLEVVAAPFSQAVRLARYVHLMSRPEQEWKEVLEAIETEPRQARWPRGSCSWDRRWKELKKIACLYLKKHSKIEAFQAHALLEEMQSNVLAPNADAFLKEKGPKLLHLGCGTNLFAGWYNTDAAPIEGAAFLDFLNPFPFPEESLDAMFCEHTIEHVPKSDALSMLKETFRTLKKGGCCRVVTPSLVNMISLIHAPGSPKSVHYLKWFREWNGLKNATLSDAFNAIFYMHGHQHIYAPDELEDMLAEIGFTNIRRLRSGEYAHDVFKGKDSHGDVIGEDISDFESFALEAEKPS